MQLSGEHLGELIGLIYDCAIDPAGWDTSIDRIRLDLGFHNGSLEAFSFPSASTILRVTAGISEDYAAMMPRYGRDVFELWGGAERMASYPLEEPIVGSQAVGRPHMEANRYYREWCQPQGVVDAVAIAFVRDAEMLGSIAFGQHVSAPAIGEAELVPLRILAPHFRRAVSINRLLNLQALRAASFSSTLDALDTAILFVDETMRIAYSNGAAQDLLSAGDLLAQSQGGLRLIDRVASEELAAAVTLAVRSEARLGRRGVGIPTRRRAGEPAVIHVLPLGGTRRAALMGQAMAALFVTPSPAAPALPVEALARLYDLTPAEARVMELIAEGRTPAEASERLGIALGTTKSHLRQIFGKTGCNRQADLAALANAFRSPGAATGASAEI